MLTIKISKLLFVLFWQELGDVENWSQVIEAEMTSIAGALEYAYKGEIYPVKKLQK
jgi:hypothetical protein